jgi:TetR/AcrR family transcriptional regulator
MSNLSGSEIVGSDAAEPKAGAPVRRRSRGPQTRAEIVAAAEHHFATRGFEAARLEDIAADVGIRRAAIFYYFADKHELYAAVLEEVFRSTMATHPTQGSAAERLEGSLTGWIDFVVQRPNVARLILREAANAQPGVVSQFARAGAAPVAWFRSVIDEGVASGELKPLIEPHRFMSLVGAITVFHFAAMPWLTLDLPFDPWGRAEIEKHKQEILLVARTMLGIAPKPPARRARNGA